MLVNPVLEKSRQEDCYEFKANLFWKIMSDNRKCETQREQIIDSGSHCIKNNMAGKQTNKQTKTFLNLCIYLILQTKL